MVWKRQIRKIPTPVAVTHYKRFERFSCDFFICFFLNSKHWIKSVLRPSWEPCTSNTAVRLMLYLFQWRGIFLFPGPWITSDHYDETLETFSISLTQHNALPVPPDTIRDCQHSSRQQYVKSMNSVCTVNGAVLFLDHVWIILCMCKLSLQRGNQPSPVTNWEYFVWALTLNGSLLTCVRTLFNTFTDSVILIALHGQWHKWKYSHWC